MSDRFFLLGSSAAVIALLLGIFGFGLIRKRYDILAGINAVVAVGAFVASARHIAAAIRYNETSMLLFLALQVSVAGVFAAQRLGVRVPAAVIVTQAIVNLLLMGLLAAFLISFNFNRLF